MAAAPSAHAACLLGTDPDGDLYGPAFPPPSVTGCPPVPDCDQARGDINPGMLEDLDTPEDDNCNGRPGMSIVFTAPNFGPYSGWVPSGWTLGLGDHGKIGNLPAAPGAMTRAVSLPLNRSIVVTLDVSALSGTGCELALSHRTADPMDIGVTTIRPVVGTGVEFFDYTGAIAPGRVLTQIRLACAAGSSMTVDWLQVQDALAEFGPPTEMSVVWQDTRLPGGGHTVGLVRQDTWGRLYMGSDVGGLARYDGDGWQVSNGSGATSIQMGGTSGVSDILPMNDGSGEVYVLMGDSNASDALGGLWRSLDWGDSWEQLASAAAQFPGSAAADTSDDVCGNPRESNCDEWVQAGGLLLQAESVAGAAGDVVYIANADEDARGVSLYDGATACALPNSGDPLPADYVGALLRVDVLPNATPVLVVGYRARLNLGASVYVCSLPATALSCSGGATADCQEVTVGDGGIDVRDLQKNTWLSDVAEVTDETGVLIADGGGRPVDADADDLPDATCTHYGGNVSQLVMSDVGGFGVVTVAVEDDILTGADVADIAGGTDLTGISLDPLSQYLFLNTPAGGNQKYLHDRMYRVDADALFDTAVVSIEAVNAGDGPAMNEEDYWEWVRNAGDMDKGGAWMESEINGRSMVFPARAAPGDMPDVLWFDPIAFAGGGEIQLAAGITGFGAWLIEGLADPWLDNEPWEALYYPSDTTADAEADVSFTFWPDIDAADHLTFQYATAWEAYLAPDGHLWAANGDSGLQHLDATVAATAADPYGAEVDCLWNGWSASLNSLAVVDRLVPPDGEANLPVIWGSMRDQSVAGYNHETGVVRTMDNGASWEYAGSAFNVSDGPTGRFHDVVDDAWNPSGLVYGHRSCIDYDPTHYAEPFADLDPSDEYSPAHAFSASPLRNVARAVTTPSLGQTGVIRALNEFVAIVLLRPDEEASGDDGGLYLTTNGGSTWALLDFDGGTGACAAATTYGDGSFEIIHPGGDSWWDPLGTDQGELELLFSVDLVATGASCALAKVSVADAGAGLTTSWDWYSLPKLTPTAAGSCGVYYDNMRGSMPAPWSDEAMIYASYTRSYTSGTDPAPRGLGALYGGACLVDLNTGALTVVVDPWVYPAGIGHVAPHPQVADLWALVPELEVSQPYCATDKTQGTYTGTAVLDCPTPWPMLVKGTAAAGFQLTELSTSYPHFAPTRVSWSDIGVPDDSADGSGSWLVVTTSGGGTWRGELSW